MKIEDCRPGVKVFLRGEIVRNNRGGMSPVEVKWEMNPQIEIPVHCEPEWLFPVNTVCQPPYDPCRPYRKGDIVKARLRGRGFPWAKDGELFTVAEDERPGNPVVAMEQRCPALDNNQVHLFYAEIELVQPAEERITYDVLVWDAIRMMRDDRKVMERPFIGADGKPDYCEPTIRMRYVPGSGFQQRMKGPMGCYWQSYSLNKNDMEVMWHEADGREEK